MNQSIYRLLFNRARGQLMAVAEFARGASKSCMGTRAGGSRTNSVIWARQRVLAVGIGLGLGTLALSPLVQAQIVADPAAPGNQRPTILSTGNGIPLVNIMTPSAAGVSRNTYSQFDVQRPGAVLNNSRTNVQTQQGGLVQANSWLAGGAAKVILNEVNASSPSQLRGYVEVAGQRAEVVIANPAGINVDGGGFINASRVTLTTGVPQISSGNLEAYRVTQGTISINGQGLDARDADYAGILARAIQVNAGVWAKDLRVVAGANQISAADYGQPTIIAGSGAAPAYALDVSNLGGMYANNIWLIGTEAGLGVNNAGTLGATSGNLVVQSNGWLANSGEMQAKAADLNINVSGALTNSGVLKAAANLTLAAASVDNHNTSSASQGIESNNLQISAETINNDAGAIRAANSARLNSAGSISNANGTISAGTDLTINDPASGAARTLAITNSNGTLVAGTLLDISANRLTGDGKLLSQQDMAIDLIGDFSNTGQIAAKRDIRFTTAGSFTNNASMQAGNNLSLSAYAIDNQVAGEMLANTQTELTATANLTNRGLIDGATTHLSADTLTNLGTGRIYGDQLAIAAAHLVNDVENNVSATIAARARLDLGIGSLANREHSLIYSAGDMAIGGSLDANHRASGTASSLDNSSATIEAQGNLSLSATAVRNTNAHFSTHDVVVCTTSITEYQGVGSSNRYAAGTPGVSIYNDESDHLRTPEGSYESWNAYRYTRTITDTQIKESDPAQILAGGAININGDSLLNDKSKIIAGGDLNVNVATLTNTEVFGTHRIHDSGTATGYWRDHQKGRDSTGSINSAYTPADTVQTITLTPTVYQANTTPTLSGSAPAQAIRSANPALALPSASLYRQHPEPGSRYLIETDPRFADYRTWLSSDYMLNALSYDPATVQKRLGDGFYEQKLIREQVANLTGQRFLADYSSDEAQYQALMDNGVTYAQEHHLRPGIALTPEQVAQLTSDIVWLVTQTVTLADGTKQDVLVPQVYVRVKDGDLSPSGALLAGKNITLDLKGDLTNAGTLAGRQVTQITAENLANLNGRISGNDVQINARADLNNVGGTLQGGNSLTATAGHDLNIASTTRTQASSQGSRSNLDRVAGLYVTGADGQSGTLIASAGHDLKLIAGVIQNQGTGDTVLQAANDLKLGTVTTAQTQQIIWDGDNRRSDSQSQEVGSQISGQGNVALVAGNDLTARAAQVSAQGDLIAAAGKTLTVEEGRQTVSVDEAHQHTGTSSWTSTKTYTTRDTLQENTSVGSRLGGKTVTLQARDINIQGSETIADQNLQFNAQNDIRIEAAQNRKQQ